MDDLEKILSGEPVALAENMADVARRMSYIVDRISSDQNLKDLLGKNLHDTAYLVERRDSTVIYLLQYMERKLCMGKGHHLIQWPSFEEMLNEQKKK